MKLVSEHPLLIGQILARANARIARANRRRTFFARLLGRRERLSRRAVFSPTEIVICNPPTP